MVCIYSVVWLVGIGVHMRVAYPRECVRVCVCVYGQLSERCAWFRKLI